MTLTKQQIIEKLRKETESYGSMSVFASKAGVSTAFVSAVLKGEKLPSGKILKALGYEKKTVYAERDGE